MQTSWLKTMSIFVLWAVVAASAHAQVPPSADRVFPMTAAQGAKGALVLNWTITPGNYLYRDKIKVTSLQGAPVEVKTPPGAMKDDPSFGETEIYHVHAQATVPAESLADLSGVVVSFQGCAEQGICYPPVTKILDLATMSIAEPSTRASSVPPQNNDWVSDSNLESPDGPAAEQSGNPQDMDGLHGKLASMLVAFVGFGVLLAFTPCVFPMIPILSGMLVQSGDQLTAWRGFVLSGSYVVAMALAYASLGVVVAWSGQNLQAALQTPVALGLTSATFIALALSMFGFYDLQLPQSWQARLVGASGGRRGSLGGAAIMGFASALIVGPCVTPPLAAALVYVAQGGNVMRGASALFALGIGMGLPLLAFGTFGARVLPKSGPWLARVKHAFGFIFVGLAILMIARVVPTWVTVVMSVAALSGIGIYLVVPELLVRGRTWSPWSFAMGLLSLALGVVVIVDSSMGVPGFVAQLAEVSGTRPIAAVGAAEFQTVRTVGALDDAIATARHAGKSVVLDFSADWCVECKIMDRSVFSDAAVLRHLNDFALIRADATDYNDQTRTLMKRFDVVGPPTVIFLRARDGKETANTRIVGPVDAATFLKRLDQFRPT